MPRGDGRKSGERRIRIGGTKSTVPTLTRRLQVRQQDFERNIVPLFGKTLPRGSFKKPGSQRK